MVRWVNAQNFGSDLGDAIAGAAGALWGDTLTPALRREELAAAQARNAGLRDFQTNVRDWARTAPARGGPVAAPQPADPLDPGAIGNDAMRAVIRQGLIDRNLPEHVADGFVMNFQDESGLNPAINEANPIVPGSRGGFGLAQWTGPRRVALEQFADARGVDPSDVNAQLDFLMEELRGSERSAAQSILSTQDAGSAAQAIVSQFLRPAAEHQARRSAQYEAFTGAPYMPPAGPSPMTGAPSTDPGTYNPQSNQMFAELLANGVAAGQSPQDIMNAILGLTANLYGAENQATVNAAVGAGGNYAGTYSGFAQNQNRQAWETQFEDGNEVVDVMRSGVPLRVRKNEMLPGDQVILSETQVKGGMAQQAGMSREEQLAYLGAEPKNTQSADRYFSATTQRYHPSYDGITDAVTGEPLPPDAAKTSVVAANRDDAGLANPVRTGVQNQIIGLNNLKGQVAAVREIAIADPTLFGLVGRARALGQNLTEQYRQIQASAPQTAQALDVEVDAMLRSIEAARGRDEEGVYAQFLGQVYDPNLSALELYGRLLPYSAAAALAQQEGRGLSNQDVENFRAIVGDPTALFSTQNGFLTKLDLLDREIDRLLAQSQGYLADGVSQPGAQPAAAPVSAAGQTQAAPGAPELPSPEDISRWTNEDITSFLQQDIAGLPPEITKPLIDAIMLRQEALGLQ